MVVEIKTPLDKYLDRVKTNDDVMEMLMETFCKFECFYNGANLFLSNNKPLAAYKNIKKAMEFAKEKEQLMKGYELIGRILVSVGYFEEALSFFEKSLKLAEETKDIEKQINILNSIANTHFRKKETKKSLEYYQKALQLCDNINTEEKSHKIAAIYNNIAITYSKEKEYEKAIEYLKKAIEIDNDEKSSLYKLNIGHTYMEIKDYENAEKYLSEALESFKKAKDKLGEAESYEYFALYYKEKGNTEKAIEYYQKAYKILNLIGKKDDAERILEEIEKLNKQNTSQGAISG